MENQLMNLNDFKKNLTDKVKLEFANLIPDNVMEEFITKTVKEFEENELPKLMMEVLKEHAKEQIKTMLKANSYGMWNHEKNMYELSPELEKVLIHAAPKMFGSIMSDVARMTIGNMQGNMM
jgi:hypothetical protein